MQFKIYVQDKCDFCKELNIPENLDVEQVYINRDDFEGFRPAQVPVMQTTHMQLDGPYQINEFLKIVSDAKDGKY